jgi:hypothetical protein
MVFNNAQVSTPLQFIFREVHWIRFWTLLQKGGGHTPLEVGLPRDLFKQWMGF